RPPPPPRAASPVARPPWPRIATVRLAPRRACTIVRSSAPGMHYSACAGEHVMTAFSKADLAARPPRVEFPKPYNAAVDLVERNLPKRRAHTAFIDDGGRLTYGELADRVGRAANALRALGLHEEQRVALLMLDTADFPVAFLGAIRAGLVAVPLNTLLTTD